MEVYKTIFETWRSQVDSYWQRNTYFAAFETAALAGCWYLVEHSHPGMGMFVSILAIGITIVWLLSNSAVHSYIEYWLKAIMTIEKKLSLDEEGFDFASKHPGSGALIRYSTLVQLVPMLFMIAWIGLFLVAFCYLCSRCAHSIVS